MKFLTFVLVAVFSTPQLVVGQRNDSKFQASTADKYIEIINLYKLEEQAKKNMEAGAFGYIRGGSEDEINLKSNTVNFEKRQIMQRIMMGIERTDVDLKTALFGIPLSTPIIQAPMAAQGLAHIDGEKATAMAMKEIGTIFTLSTYGNKTVEEVMQTVGDYPFFFQLYMNKSDKLNQFLIDEAKKYGARAIVLTVDSPIGGYREDDLVNNFSFTAGFANLDRYAELNPKEFKSVKGSVARAIYTQGKQAFTLDDIQYVKKMSGLPIIVKGILAIEDAERVISAGADGIWVSNHGGRQLDSAPATIDVLESIARVVDKRVPIIFDSGVRRGSHVFKALASGADIVAVGRPILYGLNLGGAKGVESVIAHLNKELIINMLLGGAKNIEEVKATKLYPHEDYN